MSKQYVYGWRLYLPPFLMAGWLVNEEACPLQLNIWLNFLTI